MLQEYFIKAEERYITRNHTFIHSIVEIRRNYFGETIKMIVYKLLRSSKLVV